MRSCTDADTVPKSGLTVLRAAPMAQRHTLMQDKVNSRYNIVTDHDPDAVHKS
jgi:hypothetical protein